MKRFFNTTPKMLVWFTMLNATVQIYLCFLLAFMGKPEVLEALGKTIVAEIVAPLAIYVISSQVGNVFEKNDIFPKKDKHTCCGDEGRTI